LPDLLLSLGDNEEENAATPNTPDVVDASGDLADHPVAKEIGLQLGRIAAEIESQYRGSGSFGQREGGEDVARNGEGDAAGHDRGAGDESGGSEHERSPNQVPSAPEIIVSPGQGVTRRASSAAIPLSSSAPSSALPNPPSLASSYLRRLVGGYSAWEERRRVRSESNAPSTRQDDGQDS